jgi:ATP-dependent helicase/DNAse subunit B
VRWFVERYLNATQLDPDPEPMVRGKVAHETLERTLRGLAEETGSARITPDRVADAQARMREVLAEAASRTRLSASDERAAAGLRRLEADLSRYLEVAAHSDDAFAPRDFELAFGFDRGDDEDAASLPAFELMAPDGPIRLRGRIDRVDVDDAGRALVVDYKGRTVHPVDKWPAEGVFQGALYLRAVQALLGLDPAGAVYQPLGTAEMKRRGIVLDEADPFEAFSKNDRKPADEFEAALDAVVALAMTAAGQARAGALEPRPDTCTPDGECAYPGLCRCEVA